MDELTQNTEAVEPEDTQEIPPLSLEDVYDKPTQEAVKPPKMSASESKEISAEMTKVIAGLAGLDMPPEMQKRFASDMAEHPTIVFVLNSVLDFGGALSEMGAGAGKSLPPIARLGLGAVVIAGVAVMSKGAYVQKTHNETPAAFGGGGYGAIPQPQHIDTQEEGEYYDAHA